MPWNCPATFGGGGQAYYKLKMDDEVRTHDPPPFSYASRGNVVLQSCLRSKLVACLLPLRGHGAPEQTTPCGRKHNFPYVIAPAPHPKLLVREPGAWRMWLLKLFRLPMLRQWHQVGAYKYSNHKPS